MPSQIRPLKPTPPQNLIDFAQQHEREWGTENYLNRPSLAEILGAKVVVFWKPLTLPDAPAPNSRQRDKVMPQVDAREVITLHDTLADVDQYLTKTIRLGIVPDKQLVRVFYQQKLVKVKGIKVIYEEVSHDNDF